MLKKYFITGLLIWLPLAITFWVIRFIVTAMDDTLPTWLTPAWVKLYHIPGFGLVMAGVIVLLTGVLTANIVGAWMLKIWEAVLKRIPIVSTIYSSVKQVSDTVLSPNGQAFRKAVLVQYPRAGCWTIAFVTGTPGPGVAEHLPGEHVSVYVPTTPNPTSGFFLIIPKDEIVEVDMSVDTALKYIVSMGVVAPGTGKSAAPAPASATASAPQ